MCKCNPSIRSFHCHECVPKPKDRPNVAILPYIEPYIPEYRDGPVPGSDIRIGETVIGQVPGDSVSGRNEPCGDPIIEMNVNMLRSRARFGATKYPTNVFDNPAPLREWLVHALEEVLDQANYLQRAIKAIDDGNIKP